MIEVGKIEGFGDVERKLRKLPHIARKASVSAVNKLGTQGTSKAKKRVREWYNIKLKDLKGAIVLVRAQSASKFRDERVFSMVRGLGDPLPLIKFGALPKQPPNQKGVPIRRRRPVTVKVLRQGPRQVVPHAFVASLRSTALPNIFMRKGPASHPVRTLYTVGVTKMFEKKGIPSIKELLAAKGRDVFLHEIDFYLKKEAGLIPMRGRR